MVGVCEEDGLEKGCHRGTLSAVILLQQTDSPTLRCNS